MIARLVVAVVLAVGAPLAFGHEFWIRPDRFDVGIGDTIDVGLVVGTGWPGEAFARADRRIVRFAVVDAAGERALDGRDGELPAGRTVARTSGAAWLVYRSNFAEVQLDAGPFEVYLRDEGLESAIEQRAQRGASALPGRERYSRCAKAFVTVAGAAGDGRPDQAIEPIDATKPVGLAFELVPLSDLRRVAVDGSLRVRLLFNGRPLPGALVKAMRQDEPGRWVAARTDAEGEATLALPMQGAVWLVNAVNIAPAPPRSGVDWQSTWMSLTFETASP